ncbi:sigma-70 family RNA polymerase sigma factor [Streptomyces sp. NPDC048527]|uniref:sigma-70 family RNA polymerase sigma factor n=1 Tax=Streptomyces sp. NPDC048527 TaxID=3365568 RepID=UPI00371522C9
MTATMLEADPFSPRLSTRHAEERMRELYQVNAASLLRTLLSWTRGDSQAAEDLVQETMLRAWRNLDALHPDPRLVRPWLLTVSRRLAIDAMRARAARPNEVSDEPLARLATTSEPFEQVLNRVVLQDAMACLSATHRTVVVHVYVMRRSVRETAEMLGVPEGTVKSRSHHALRALREALGDFHADESGTQPLGHNQPEAEAFGRQPGVQATPARKVA